MLTQLRHWLLITHFGFCSDCMHNCNKVIETNCEILHDVLKIWWELFLVCFGWMYYYSTLWLLLNVKFFSHVTHELVMSEIHVFREKDRHCVSTSKRPFLRTNNVGMRYLTKIFFCFSSCRICGDKIESNFTLISLCILTWHMNSWSPKLAY